MEAKKTPSHSNDYRVNPVTKQKSALCDDFDEDEDDVKMNSRGWRDKDEVGRSDFTSNAGSFKRVPTVQRLEDMVIETIGESRNGSNSSSRNNSSSTLYRSEHDSRTNSKKEESSRMFPPNSNYSADQTSSRSLIGSSQPHTLFKSGGRADSSNDAASMQDSGGRYKDKHTGDRYRPYQQQQQHQSSRGREEKDRVPDISRTTTTTSSRALSNNINDNSYSSYSSSGSSNSNTNYSSSNNSYSSYSSSNSNGQCTDFESSRLPYTSTNTNTSASTVFPTASSSKSSSAVKGSASSSNSSVGAVSLGSKARSTLHLNILQLSSMFECDEITLF